MQTAFIEVHKPSENYDLVHKVRLYLLEQMDLDVIPDSGIITDIIKEMNRQEILKQYKTLEVHWSKNDARLKKNREIVAYVGRYTKMGWGKSRYNVYLIKKID